MTPTFFATLEGDFASIMRSLYPGIPFYFENVEVDSKVPTFVVFHIMASEDALPINFGRNAKSRNVGVLQIDVFTPKGTGAGRGREMAWKVAQRLTRRDISCGEEGLVTTKDAAVQARGFQRGRDKQMASIPYRYDFNPTIT